MHYFRPSGARLFQNPVHVIGAGFLGAVGADIGIPYLVGVLSNELRAPVLDKTNLTGGYDIALTWAAFQTEPSNATPTASIFTALLEVGLRLEAQRGPSGRNQRGLTAEAQRLRVV